jgi:tRNA (guanine-N7-)-methyltransferase
LRSRRRLSREELQPYLYPDTPRGTPAPRVDWVGLFGNDNPVEIEVGFGKGLFLLTAALQSAGTNFFGIEVVRKLQLYAATRIAVRHLANVRFACADAGLFMRELIPDATVQTVHVYFPDPWWKKRHKKRRVFTSEFAAGACRVLRSGGQLSIATDVEEYFGVMTEVASAISAFQLVSQSTDDGQRENQIQTNFERKAYEQDRKVHRALYRKL